jgi:hypothetical protein
MRNYGGKVAGPDSFLAFEKSFQKLTSQRVLIDEASSISITGMSIDVGMQAGGHLRNWFKISTRSELPCTSPNVHSQQTSYRAPF